MAIKGKTIVIGVTGGIAAYKVLKLVSALRVKGASVHIIMTHSASQLVDLKEFERVSKNPVATSLFDPQVDYHAYLRNNKPIKHISLADIADLFLICPATANSMAKLAHGIADDMLSTSALATSAPLLICPAMNVKMWKHPATQNNVATLQTYGYDILQPAYGMLACGYKGVGRLANLDRIIERIETILARTTNLAGLRMLITAGATSEAIDPVRVITNKSSGKMGVFLAEEAVSRGATVTLIRSVHAVEPQKHMKEILITSVKDLHAAVKKEAKHAEVIIHAAAVSDFALNGTKKTKIKSGAPLQLELTPTTKIFEKIKSMNNNVFLVGFKAESNVSKKELHKRAFILLKSARADLIVANDIGKKDQGFDVDTNEVLLIDKKNRATKIKKAHKRVIGNKILDKIRNTLK